MTTSPFSPLAERLRSSGAYRELRQRVLETSRAVRVVRLPVAAAPWLLDCLATELGQGYLAVVGRESEALAWAEASRLFSPDKASRAVYFPAPALTPYQEAEVSLGVRAQEALALDAMTSQDRPRAVCTPRALFALLPEASSFDAAVRTLRVGEEHPIDRLAAYLVARGYRRSDLVTEIGVFSIRGGVFDLFPPGESLPLRLDYFGDSIESIRHFDPTTQRSLDAVVELRVHPLALFDASPDRARDLAETLAAEVGAVGEEAARRLEGMAEGEPFPGWENYLPLLEENTSSLLERFGKSWLVVVDSSLLVQEVEHHVELLGAEYEARRELGACVVPPSAITVDPQAIHRALAEPRLEIDELAHGSSGSKGETASLDFGASLTDPLDRQLARFPREVEIARARGDELWLVVSSELHAKTADFLSQRHLDGQVTVVEGELGRGFRLPAAGVVFYSDTQLFARHLAPRQPRVASGPFLSTLRDLKVGEFVVHEDHGIGRFIGMRSLEPAADGAPLPASLRGYGEAKIADVELMEIEYAGERTLLLPLHRIHQVQKYSGLEGTSPRLDRLGGSSWVKAKSRVKKGLRKLATDLLELYAERELAKAPIMQPDSDAQVQFETAFAYEETPDQLEATAAIKADLEQSRPMDRLLCGDVGFGKTEVAMRAAWKTVDSGYQVAVLAPTTILADQHLETFRSRFEAAFPEGSPVRIEMLSRFRSAGDVKKVKEEAAAGTVDILIGTHRLLSRDVSLPRLGLLIVDEEQRFGVAQKERFKELRKNVHVLSMSATPVPRTLQLSLAGVRDMSVIESPPKDRMAVDTRILPFTADLVREAIEFEVERGGQVYYVYNRVEGIESQLTFLRDLVPGIRVTYGHGQMDEKELSRRMHAFVAGEYDLLLATTIIENGIDIPNVNTMIVHRADRFGLAQLYQLRGRVGRSDQLAFCYLLVPPDRVLSEDARKRLTALREFSDLGAGFRIAARDLEIRGAGNLLGAEQSGHIVELGIETYMKMLEDTVRELRGEATEAPPSAQIDLPLPLSIPKEYVSDANLRMELYRRLASDRLVPEEFRAELRDRFGPPPQRVLSLIDYAILKQTAERLRVQSIRQVKSTLSFSLRRDATVDVEALIGFVSEHPAASFSPEGVLKINGVPERESLVMAQRVMALLDGRSTRSPKRELVVPGESPSA